MRHADRFPYTNLRLAAATAMLAQANSRVRRSTVLGRLPLRQSDRNQDADEGVPSAGSVRAQPVRDADTHCRRRET